MSPEGRLPWTKEEDCRSICKSREKDVKSDLENKLLFEDVFREKFIAKFDNYKNFLSQSRFE